MTKIKKSIVFLDRDGVINRFPGNGNYVTKIKNFHFIPKSLEALRILTESGFTIFVISNQAGVGKGIFTNVKLNAITRYMIEKVKKKGGRIKKVFYCTHKSDAGCDCRKPKIGSIQEAFKIVKKDIREAPKSYFVGDTKADILAGCNAGCQTIFVLSGREDRRDIKKWKVKPNYVAKDLMEATKIINNENSRHLRLSRSRAQKSRRSGI